MNISKYRAFIHVIESGSLTRAAKKLGYSQPGISHMVDSLEQEFGFALLIRNKDKIRATENGKKVLHYCYQIVKNEDYLQETVSAINGILEGTLNIGAYNSTLIRFVPQVIRNFANVYSNIQFNVQEFDYAGFHEALPKGSIDLGFMTDAIPKGFTFVPLFRDPSCVIMRKDHPFASFEKIPPALLNGCDFIMPTTGSDDILNIIMEKHLFLPNIKHYVSSDIATISLVSQNLGVSVIPSLQTALLPEHVIAKEFVGNYSRNIGIAIKSLKHSPPAIREFIRIAQETAAQMFPDQEEPQK